MNKKVLAVLVVVTVCVVSWNVTLATYPPPTPMLEIRAVLISEPPLYWNLTDPDARILEVLLEAGVFKMFPRNETTILDQVKEHGDVWKVRYEGNYYEFEALGSYDIGLPETYPIHVIEHGGSGLGLAAMWIAFGIAIWKKKV